QVPFQAAGIDADADRAAVGLGRADHFLDPLFRADVARVNAQARSTGTGRPAPPFVVKMDVGDDRYAGCAHDLLERGSRFHVRAGHADDVRPGLLATADLVDRRPGVGGRRIGHGLHGNRRVAANGDVADHDLAGLAGGDVAPRTDWGHCSSTVAP